MLYFLFVHVLRSHFSPLNVFRYITVRTALASLTAMFLSLVFGPWVIRRLREMQIGQFIRTEGPERHQSKAGTPTMGGVLIVGAIAIPTLLWADLRNVYALLALTSTLAFAAIGFVDDYRKVIRRQNLGLTTKKKLAWQILTCITVGAVLLRLQANGEYSTALSVPFFKRLHPDLVIRSLWVRPHLWPIAVIPFMLFLILVIVGSSNAVNLTDGLDGLAIGCVLVAAGALTVLTYVTSHARFAEYLEIQKIPDAGELTIFCGSVLGASLGFLWYNAHPAELFMGDVGSLALGGAIGTVAVIIKQEILLLSIGGDIRDRSTLCHFAGGFIQAARQTHLPYGAAAPPFRAAGLERIENHRAILDRRAVFRVVFADHPEAEVRTLRPGIELSGKRVLVVGLARTGIATALFCAAHGARVTATEERPEAEVSEAAEKLRAAGAALALGGHPPNLFLEHDLIIVSPGVPAALPLLQMARSHEIPVWSEIELAWRMLRGRLIAITGSNGKTTTTALTAHILDAAHIPMLVGGNIGTPLISRVESSSDSTVTVAEVSSFQLEMIEAFRPDVGVMLNVTPDHLDRHISVEEYARAKARLFENQIERDAAVLNADDPGAAQLLPSRPQIFWFSRLKRVVAGAFLRGDDIVFRRDGMETVLLRRDEISLRGEHNVENVLAACIAARLAGAEPAEIVAGVHSFAGVEHRLQFVAEINGVSFYNDSKATNVDAALKAIEAFSSPLILILGGKDKGSDYTLLREPLRHRVRLVYLIGAAAEKIGAQLAGSVPVEHVGNLERAVREGFERARPGDTVLLAPACASFDQFENFEHRGRVFKQLVERLEHESSASAPAGKG